jgi:hypothetical protein
MHMQLLWCGRRHRQIHCIHCSKISCKLLSCCTCHVDALQDMRFDNTFVHELPGDKETTNSLRQVRLLVQHHQASSRQHCGATVLPCSRLKFTADASFSHSIMCHAGRCMTSAGWSHWIRCCYAMQLCLMRCASLHCTAAAQQHLICCWSICVCSLRGCC